MTRLRTRALNLILESLPSSRDSVSDERKSIALFPVKKRRAVQMFQFTEQVAILTNQDDKSFYANRPFLLPVLVFIARPCIHRLPYSGSTLRFEGFVFFPCCSVYGL